MPAATSSHGTRVSIDARVPGPTRRYDHLPWSAIGMSSWNMRATAAAGIVGLDVDHTADSAGGDSLADLEDKLGPLPRDVRGVDRVDSMGLVVSVCLALPGDYAGILVAKCSASATSINRDDQPGMSGT